MRFFHTLGETGPFQAESPMKSLENEGGPLSLTASNHQKCGRTPLSRSFPLVHRIAEIIAE
jgi:hypothetical protein